MIKIALPSAFDELGLAPTIKALTDDLADLWTSDKAEWVVGYSGGKDSTATLSLVWRMLAGLPPEARNRPVHVITTDTMVENPVVSAWVNRSHEAMAKAAQEQGLPIVPHRLQPAITDTFWVSLIGKGYAAPRPMFRWCTDRLKIKPSNAFITNLCSKGQVILVLGTRKAESAARARTMTRLERGRTRDRLSPNASLPGSLVCSPIEDWSNDDVWLFLLQGGNPWNFTNRDLLTMYRGASADNECPLVVETGTPSCGDSRFGCWTCTMVEQDKSMSAMIQNDEEKSWMEPMLDLRNELDLTDDRHLRDHRRMNGLVQLHKGRLVPGPYTQATRAHWLKRVLEVQAQVRQNAPEDVRDLALITQAELHEIRRQWVIEKHEVEDLLPQVYLNATGQPYPGPDLNPGALLSDPQDRALLLEACGGDQARYLLLRDLLDVERQFHPLDRRKGLHKAIDQTFRKHSHPDPHEALAFALDRDAALHPPPPAPPPPPQLSLFAPDEPREPLPPGTGPLLARCRLFLAPDPPKAPDRPPDLTGRLFWMPLRRPTEGTFCVPRGRESRLGEPLAPGVLSCGGKWVFWGCVSWRLEERWLSTLNGSSERPGTNRRVLPGNQGQVHIIVLLRPLASGRGVGVPREVFWSWVFDGSSGCGSDRAPCAVPPARAPLSGVPPPGPRLGTVSGSMGQGIGFTGLSRKVRGNRRNLFTEHRTRVRFTFTGPSAGQGALNMPKIDFPAAFETFTFGVEIETSGYDREQVAQKLAGALGWTARRPSNPGYYDRWEVVMGDGRVWTCMKDGSIQGPTGTEVVSPILKGEADVAILQDVTAALASMGCKSTAALGCGIHVHVGVKALSAAALGRLAKLVAKQDQVLRVAVGVDSARGRWCKPLSQEHVEKLGKAQDRGELAQAWYGVSSEEEAREESREHYNQSRYHGLNLHSVFYTGRNTAEFRYFNGTLDAFEVAAYVRLCVGLVNFANQAKSVSTKDRGSHVRGIKTDWLFFLNCTLGMKGNEYKNARLCLAKGLPRTGGLSGVAA